MVAAQDGPHRDRVDGMPQVRQGTLDPAIAPARVAGHLRCSQAAECPALCRCKTACDRLRLEGQAARWAMAQDLLAQVGKNHPTNAPMVVFRTQDGYMTIAASRPMWRKLCIALGAPALLERPEYATAASGVTHREALNAEIERLTQTQTSAA
jgi:CoA-transferase family III